MGVLLLSVGLARRTAPPACVKERRKGQRYRRAEKSLLAVASSVWSLGRGGV